MKTLVQSAANSTDHKVEFTNLAKWGEASDEAKATYTANPLTKEVIGWPSPDNNYVATYKITINPDKITLNGGNRITVEDTMLDNMRLITDSMTVTADGDSCSDYTYDFDTSKTKFTMTVPDEKCVVITYDVKIMGAGESVKYKNDVEITGEYESSTGEKSINIESKGGGIGSEIGIRVIKRDKDTKKTLAGAQFKLYKKSKDGEYYPVKDTERKDVVFTTNENGVVELKGGNDKGWHLSLGNECYLKEITAPVGYKTTADFYFTVSELASGQGYFANGDTIDIFDESEGGEGTTETTESSETTTQTTTESTQGTTESTQGTTESTQGTTESTQGTTESTQTTTESTQGTTESTQGTTESTQGTTESTQGTTESTQTTTESTQGTTESTQGTTESTQGTTESTQTTTESTQGTTESTETTEHHGRVAVRKTITYHNMPLFSKNAVSFYVALYEDEACTKLAAPLKEIRIQGASSTEVTFDNLEAGKTYYVAECNAKGEKIYTGKVEDGTVYNARFTGTNGNTVKTTDNGTVQVVLDNQMDELPDGYYIEGELHVTKKLLGTDKKPEISNDVFYAGVFSDPEHTKLSTLVDNNILELKMDGKSQAEAVTTVSIPDENATVKLYVTEVDKDGKPVADAPDFRYDVNVEGAEVVMTAKNNTASVTITNTEEESEKTEDTSITVVKTISFKGLPLLAENVSFYAALYYDKECTRLAAPQKEIVFKNAISSQVTFDHLEIGRTYYVGECDADGKVIYSGAVKGGVTYQAKFTGTNGNKVVTVKDGNTKVALDNQMSELPDGFYIEGMLHVTKKLLDVDGEPMTSDEVFYAGIFEDPEHTKLSDLAGSKILALNLGGNSQVQATTSITLPTQDSVVKVYVTEVDANGVPVADAPDFTYQVSVDGEMAELSMENNEAYVTITNQETEEETEEESEEQSEEKKDTKSKGTSKTSDNTPVLPMAILLAASALGAAWILIRRRRS